MMSTNYKKKQVLGKKLYCTLALTTITVTSNAAPVNALNVNFTYDPGVSWSYKRAAEFAELYWEDRITDDAKINIHLDVASANKLPSGVLGGAIPAFENNVYVSDFTTALKNDRHSSDDYTAFDNLPLTGDNGERWEQRWGAYIEGSRMERNRINLTRANAKALDLIDGYSNELDGVILLSDLSNVSYSWEDKRTDYVNSYEFDLTSVLIHEVGHIMGFVSAVDSINADNFDDRDSRVDYITPLNMFSRDAGNSKTLNRASVVYGQDSYFSIDGGQTNLGYFSRGENTNLGNFGKGDGWQASHWKNNIDAMMNPLLANGKRRGLTDRDLTVFDVMGWNRGSVNYSDSTLRSWADNNANNNGNTNKTSDLDKIFNQRGWGGNSRSTTYRQDMELADYLHQEGLFQMGSAGALWSTFDERPRADERRKGTREFDPAAAESASVPEPASILSLLGLGLLSMTSRKKKNWFCRKK